MPPPPFPRSLQDRYSCTKVLGQGAMGVVFQVTDRELDRPVALKLLRGTDTEAAKRFLLEAAGLSRVEHANVVRCLDYGEVPEGPYLVMELLEAAPLSEAPPGVDPLEAMLQVAEALEAVHEAGFVHRDVKPSNVVTTPEGRVVLVDFGLVKKPGTTGITREGVRVGTVVYMAPELLRGGSAGPETDWYSWGVSLYQLVEGRLPFLPDTMMAVARGKALPELKFYDSTTEQVRRAIRATLREDPDSRAQSRAAIEAAMADPESSSRSTLTSPVKPARVAEPVTRPVKPVATRSLRPRVALGAGLLALLGLGWFTTGAPRVPEAPDPVPATEADLSPPESLVRAAGKLAEHYDSVPRPYLGRGTPEEHLGRYMREIVDPRAPIRLRRFLRESQAWMGTVAAAGPRGLESPEVHEGVDELIMATYMHLFQDVVLVRESIRRNVIEAFAGVHHRMPVGENLPGREETRKGLEALRQSMQEGLDSLGPFRPDEPDAMLLLRAELMGVMHLSRTRDVTLEVQRRLTERPDHPWRVAFRGAQVALLPDVSEQTDMSCEERNQVVLGIFNTLVRPPERISSDAVLMARCAANTIWFATLAGCAEVLSPARLAVLRDGLDAIARDAIRQPESVDLILGWTMDNARAASLGAAFPDPVMKAIDRIDAIRREARAQVVRAEG